MLGSPLSIFASGLIISAERRENPCLPATSALPRNWIDLSPNGEVVRAALRSLEYEEEDRAEKAAWLRRALDEGLASGVARGDVFARVRRKVGLPVEKK